MPNPHYKLICAPPPCRFSPTKCSQCISYAQNEPSKCGGSDSLDKDGSQYEPPTENNEFSVLMVCGHNYIASLAQCCLSQVTTKQKVLKVNSLHYQDNILNISLCCSGHILHGHLWPPCKEVQVAGHPSPRFSLYCIFTHSYSHPFVGCIYASNKVNPNTF